jgi:hypothetical protein
MSSEDFELMNKLSINIMIYRIKANLSQELSIIIGKPKDYIERLESLKLKKIPPVAVVIDICKTLNTSLESLIGENYFQKIVMEGI